MGKRGPKPGSKMRRNAHRRGPGRPKGAKSLMDEEARRVAAATGITPLEYMLSVMRDPEVRTERRDAMAIAAAPYMHAKLAQLKHLGDPNNPVREIHRIERVIYDAKTGEALAEIDGQLRPAPADHVQNIQTIEGEAEEIPDIEREAAD